MPRSKQGIKRTPLDKEQLRQAVQILRENKMPLSAAAKYFNISRTTLRRHFQHCSNRGTDISTLHDNLTHHKVFTDEEELMLCDYIKEAADLQYGLTLKNVQIVAYQFAKHNNKKYPATWDEYEMAGDYWLRSFRKRYPQLSLRKPEATSLGRSTAFNKTNVAAVFTNYKAALTKCPNILPSNIWNIDETGLSTVHVPPKILGPKGVKQIGSMTSAERGSTVTMICAINAGGGFIPPMLIFPRVNFKDFMITNAPPGTVGGANPSGWSNENLFFQFMKHFIKHVRPSTNSPCVVLLDNHESHISVPVIDLAKRNGIILMTFHPHTSHKLQPLDKGVFGPFKKYYSTATNELMISPGYVGKPITIYNVATLVGKAFPLAFTPNNIMQGFKATGMYPVNENIFDDSDFLSAQVTDRPYDVTSDKSEDANNTAANTDILPHLAPEAQISAQSVAEADIPSTSAVTNNIVTPTMIRPHPKAAPRKNKGRGRQKGKSCILTDTPEKTRIEMLKMASLMKKKREKNVKLSLKDRTKGKSKKKPVKRKIVSDSESSISDDNFSLRESDVSEMSFDIHDDEVENSNPNSGSGILKFKINDFVIFVYENEYFPGKIVDIIGQEFVIKSMEKSLKNWKWPEREDRNLYPVSDIKQIIEPPKKISCTREVYAVPQISKFVN